LTGINESIEDDSGAGSLRALGMSVTEYDRAAITKLPGYFTAQFYLSHPAAVTDTMNQLMEEELRGSVFVSGRHGDATGGRRRGAAARISVSPMTASCPATRWGSSGFRRASSLPRALRGRSAWPRDFPDNSFAGDAAVEVGDRIL
jgi:hypothetical protein